MVHDDIAQLKQLLRKLFRVQLFASIATIQNGRPYNNLIAYSVTDDLQSILFLTRRNTRKYANLIANNHVSVLIDSRSNRSQDFGSAIAVTAEGNAREINDDRKEALLRIHLEKHSNLEKFLRSPEAALFKADITRYIIVRNFEEVLILPMVNSQDTLSGDHST